MRHPATMRRHLALAALVSLLTLPAQTAAQELRGSASFETRLFPNDPAFVEQRNGFASPSFALEPELLWGFRDGRMQMVLRPFLRIDAHDGSRTHFDLREANLVLLEDGWALQMGFGKVFWGKTEAHHLVDIINQTDAVEDIDGEDKLGQPMVNLTWERSSGAIDFFFLPWFRERTFPGGDGRLRGMLPVQGADYESSAGRWHPDFAVRLSQYLNELDVALSVFRGTSREPVLVPHRSGETVVLRPRYDIIDQVSIDAQWTRGATLWKLEAMTRGGHGKRFLATVVGLEHSIFDIGARGSDLGLLAEVMLDGRDDEAPFTAFDHDVFLGARWAWNDAAGTSILGGPVVDYQTGEVLAFLEAERRFGDRWLTELQARWLANTDASAPLHGFRRDDFVTLQLSRYF